jgi:DeoR/GlpR family transcriptional regulator of sugar metabolism/phage tail protein X
VADLRRANPSVLRDLHDDDPLPPNVVLVLPQPPSHAIEAYSLHATVLTVSTHDSRMNTIAGLAQQHNVDEATIRQHNPEIADYADDEPLPAGAAIRLPAATAKPRPVAPSTRPSQPGSPSERDQVTIASLARRHKVSQETIRRHNPNLANFEDDDALPPNVAIRLPTSPTEGESATQRTPARATTTSAADMSMSTLRVPANTPVAPGRPADAQVNTIASLAQQHNVDEATIRQHNPEIADYADDEPLPAGAAIRLPAATAKPRPVAPSTRPSQPGSPSERDQVTIASLARRHKVSQETIRRHNPNLANFEDDDALPPNVAIRLPRSPTEGESATQRTPARATTTSAADMSMSTLRVPANTPVAPGRPVDAQVNTIAGLAQQHNVDEATIRQHNPEIADYADDEPLPAGAAIRLPAATAKPRPVAPSTRPSQPGSPSERDQVTIASLARRHKVSQETIRRHNPNLANFEDDDALPPNVAIRLPTSPTEGESATQRTPARATTTSAADMSMSTLRVPANTPVAPGRPADAQVNTIASLAQQHNVDEATIRQHNPEIADYADDEPLPAGAAIRLPAATAKPRPVAPSTRPSQPGSPSERDQVTIASLARRHKVSQETIRRHNPNLANFEDDDALPPNVAIRLPTSPTEGESATQRTPARATTTSAADMSMSTLRVPANTPVAPGRPVDAQVNTIASLAQQHNVDEATIRQHNPEIADYADDEPLPAGAAIRLPAATAKPRPVAPSTRPSQPGSPSERDQVTIASLARRHKVSQETIRRHNPNLANFEEDDALPPNVAIRLPRSPTEGESATQRTPARATTTSAADMSMSTLRVPANTPVAPGRPADAQVNTIASLAQQHNVDEATIRQHNPEIADYADDEPLPAGAAIRLPAATAKPRPVAPSTRPSQPGSPSERDQVTIASLARRHKVSQETIRRHNPNLANFEDDDALPPNVAIRLPTSLTEGESATQRTPARATTTSAADMSMSTLRVPANTPVAPGRPVDAQVNTIAGLAQQHNVDEATIRQHNPEIADYADDEPLPAGAAIRLPARATRTPARATTTSAADMSMSTLRVPANTPVAPGRPADAQVNTIASLAQQHNVDEATIRQHNPEIADYADDEPLPAGAAIRLPARATRTPARATTTSAADMSMSTLRVPANTPVAPGRPADAQVNTIAGLAQQHNVDEATIRQHNPEIADYADDEPLPAGAAIRLPARATRTPARATTTYRERPSERDQAATTTSAADMSMSTLRVPANTPVAPGRPADAQVNTIAGLAQQHNVDEATIRQHNPEIADYADDEPLPAGAAIRLPARATRTPARATTTSAADMSMSTLRVPANTPVAPGRPVDAQVNTIAGLAQQHNVDEATIRQHNPEIADYADDEPLPAGAAIRLPARATRTPARATTTSAADMSMSTLRVPANTPVAPGRPADAQVNTIASLAQQHNVDEATIRQHNPEIANYGPHEVLPSRHVVRLPLASFRGTPEVLSPASTAAPLPTAYVDLGSPDRRRSAVSITCDGVHDTVRFIAATHGCQPSDLRRANSASLVAFNDRQVLPTGLTLHIPTGGSGAQPPSSRRKIPGMSPLVLGSPAGGASFADGASLLGATFLVHPPPDAQPVAAVLSRQGQTLAAIAREHGALLATARDLNPDIRNQFAVLPAGTVVRMPVLRLPQARVAPHDDPSGPSSLGDTQRPTGQTLPANPRTVHSRPGDTVSSLCSAYRVPLGEMLRLNPALGGQDINDHLPPNTTVAVPLAAAEDVPPPAMASNDDEHHSDDVITSGHGDTVASVSRLLGVHPSLLIRLNPQLSRAAPHEPLPVGTRIQTAPPGATRPSATPAVLRRRQLDRRRVVAVLAVTAAERLGLRYYAKWRLAVAARRRGLMRGGRAISFDGRTPRPQVDVVGEDAEWGRLQFELDLARQHERDLKARVSDLRVENDALRVAATSRDPSPARSAARSRPGTPVAATTSPRRTPIGAEGISTPFQRTASSAADHTPVAVENAQLRAQLYRLRHQHAATQRNETLLKYRNSAIVREVASGAHQSPLRGVNAGRSPAPRGSPIASSSYSAAHQTNSLGLLLQGMQVVRSTGPAAAAGIQPGDHVSKVQGRLVGSAAQFRGMVRQEVERAGGDPSRVQITVTVQPANGPQSTHIVTLGRSTEGLYRSPPRRLSPTLADTRSPWLVPPAQASPPRAATPSRRPRDRAAGGG